MKSSVFILSFLLILQGMDVNAQKQDERKNPYYKPTDNNRLEVNNTEWKKVLTPKVYNIMREKGTEMANSGPYVHNDKKGVYHCASCGNALFSSANKFDSHTGWPSFYQALNEKSLAKEKDNSYGMERDEVLCARCGGHLGHVFDDGPKPTGLRYCMNGYALNFEEKR